MISVSIYMLDGSGNADAQEYETVEDAVRHALDLADHIGRETKAGGLCQRIDVLQHGNRIISVAAIAGGLLPTARGRQSTLKSPS
jgi:hypothetical protein